MLKFIFTSLIFIFSVSAVMSNNVTISNVLMTGQNTVSHYVQVQFDLSWENSWRTVGAAPFNWDAVWLFVKYYDASSSAWKHSTLSINAGDFSTGSGTGATISPGSDGKGAFIYRSADGTGTFSVASMQMRWNYSSDFSGDVLPVIQVFAIEMVYIPQGSFYVGSGGTETNAFFTYPTTTTPYQITSEDAINVGTTNGYLYYNNSPGSGGDRGGPIPALFPKGYNSFYCIKYEVTQEQYVAFLNTLNYTQQASRTNSSSPPNSSIGIRVLFGYRNFIEIATSGINSSLSAIYGCDYDNDNIFNETNDGLNISVNNVGISDALAYADWACLRPMTELEFEKAGRGFANPYPNEYAWGNTNITKSTTLSNPGSNNEIPSTSSNCNFSNTLTSDLIGPFRVGCFSNSSSDRTSSGASYFGVMDFSGNLKELCISVGDNTARSFRNNLGNGNLDAGGYHNVTYWPVNQGGSLYGISVRGGSFGDFEITLSYRYWGYQIHGLSARDSQQGIRLVR